MITKQRVLPFFMLCLTTIVIFGATEQHSHENPNEQVHVIFDVGGVMVQTSGARKILGLKKFILYALTHNPMTMKKSIKEKLFSFLADIEPRQADEVDARDEHGTQIPQILCNWMKGAYTPEQLNQMVDEQAKKYPQGLELDIIRDIAHMMFTPNSMIQTQQFVPEALEFVRELKDQGYKVYILSNFSPETFRLLESQQPEFFALFDGIVVSGDIGLIKPDLNIYEYTLTTCNIDRTKACFIDDQPVNIDAAQKVGITGILCPITKGYLSNGSPDIEAARKNFYAWREQFSTVRPEGRAMAWT